MPNHITNLISFGSDSASLSVFQRMLHDMKMDDQPLGSFDFNKLIPMPQELNIEWSSKTDSGLKLYAGFVKESAVVARATMFAPEDVRSAVVKGLLEKWDAVEKTNPEAWALGKQAFQNIQKYGHPTWYEWSVEHWGSKWNAYQPAPLDASSNTMRFLTAWSEISSVIKALSRRYPDQTITYRWADEDIGHNVGQRVFRNGECVEEAIPEGGSRSAYEMAAEIIGLDLADLNLYLNKAKTSYEHRDKPPVTKKHQTTKKPRKKQQTR